MDAETMGEWSLDEHATIGRRFAMTWHHINVRIKDPQRTEMYYNRMFKMQKVRVCDIGENSLVFLAGENADTETNVFFNRKDLFFEGMHKHGAETDPSFRISSGNDEEKGLYQLLFGVAAENNEAFAKRAGEGVHCHQVADVKWVAGVDPDGYQWAADTNGGLLGLCGVHLRVKDPQKSLAFYQDFFDLRLINSMHFPDGAFDEKVGPFGSKAFVLHQLTQLTEEQISEWDTLRKKGAPLPLETLKRPVLGLLYCASDSTPAYANGNDQGVQGFGHLAFLSNSLKEACKALETSGVTFVKKPEEGDIKDVAFILDPDKYWVEVLDDKIDPVRCCAH